MKKMLLYTFFVVIIVIITLCVLYVSGYDTNKNVKFLKEYGWIVSEKEIETEEIVIPKIFDDVYNSYNQLQKQAGLDLSLYKGKKAVRYTYIVLNYPRDTQEEIRANVICVKGKPIAGDIMTVSLDGFMHSLQYPKQMQE